MFVVHMHESIDKLGVRYITSTVEQSDYKNQTPTEAAASKA